MKDASFNAVGDRATEGDVDARLYWMALAQLSTTDRYKHLEPVEIHERMRKLALEVYYL